MNIGYIVILTFVLTVLLILQLTRIFIQRHLKLEERLKASLGQAPDVPVPEPALENKVPKPTLKKKHEGTLYRLIALPGTLVSERYLSKLRGSLIKAGIPLKAEEMTGIIIFSVLGAMLLGFLAFGMPGLLLGLLGLLIPFLWIAIVQRMRSTRLESQLLDSVVMMASSLRAGHSFMQALELVGRETPDPLGSEVGRVIRETKVGIPVEEALTNLNRRVINKDLELIVSGVLTQRQVGGNLAEVLDIISYTIDKRIKLRAKISALTAQGKISAVILSLLPIVLGLIMFIINPKFMGIMTESFAGIAMLVVGGVVLILGILWLMKVVDIDV